MGGRCRACKTRIPWRYPVVELATGVLFAVSIARFGVTPRNAVMFGPGGVSYVYLCYGVYELFNVVAGADREPGAVLIRALEPVRGIEGDARVASGPGKLTRALGLTRHAHLAAATNANKSASSCLVNCCSKSSGMIEIVASCRDSISVIFSENSRPSVPK